MPFPILEFLLISENSYVADRTGLLLLIECADQYQFRSGISSGSQRILMLLIESVCC
jgi:hypothetical protein